MNKTMSDFQDLCIFVINSNENCADAKLHGCAQVGSTGKGYFLGATLGADKLLCYHFDNVPYPILVSADYSEIDTMKQEMSNGANKYYLFSSREKMRELLKLKLQNG